MFFAKLLGGQQLVLFVIEHKSIPDGELRWQVLRYSVHLAYTTRRRRHSLSLWSLHEGEFPRWVRFSIADSCRPAVPERWWVRFRLPPAPAVAKETVERLAEYGVIQATS